VFSISRQAEASLSAAVNPAAEIIPLGGLRERSYRNISQGTTTKIDSLEGRLLVGASGARPFKKALALSRRYRPSQGAGSRMKLHEEEPLSPTGSSPEYRGAVRGASSKVSALIKPAHGSRRQG